MGNNGSSHICISKPHSRKFVTKQNREDIKENTDDDDDAYDVEASCSKIDSINSSEPKEQSPVIKNTRSHRKHRSARSWISKSFHTRTKLSSKRAEQNEEALEEKPNNVDILRQSQLNNKKPSITVDEMVVNWKVNKSTCVNHAESKDNETGLRKSSLEKHNSIAEEPVLLSPTSFNGLQNAEQLTNEFLMQIIKRFPFPTPRNSPRAPRNKRVRSMLDRTTRSKNILGSSFENDENDGQWRKKPLNRRTSDSKMICHTNNALNEIVKNTVDTIAITALPLDCWLKERLKHWCQLSGHEGTIVPASEHTLWKKQNPCDGSKEATAYKKMMDDCVCVCVPKFYKDIEYKGENFIEIEDLTSKFNHPTIMDVKMGSRTFLESEVTNPVLRKDLYEKMVKIDVNEPTEEEHEQKAITKLRYMQFRERESTTAALGFRIEAIKKPGQACQKTFQKVHDREEVMQALLKFLTTPKANDIRKQFLRRLRVIRDKTQKSNFFKTHEVIGSSLLFMYDDSCKTGIWMIDFAKSLPVEGRVLDHRSSWKIGNHEDGYLTGMDNFIQLQACDECCTACCVKCLSLIVNFDFGDLFGDDDDDILRLRYTPGPPAPPKPPRDGSGHGGDDGPTDPPPPPPPAGTITEQPRQTGLITEPHTDLGGETTEQFSNEYTGNDNQEGAEVGPLDVDASKAQLMAGRGASVPGDFFEEKVDTAFGPVTVAIVGNRSRPAIVTFHDLGLNANTCYQSFFEFSGMAEIIDKFCVYHINAPGQQEDARPLADNYTFPSMDELATIVLSVVDHLKIKRFIGIGVGAGANVLIRFTLKNGDRIDALILVNATAMACGWIEWGYQKMNVNYLSGRGMTSFTLDYLLWHHFGKHWDQCNTDLVNRFKQYFAKLSNPGNLAKFIDSYSRRNAIDISRDGPTLQCRVMQIVGQGSPFIEKSVDLNAKLDPTRSDWLKMSDCSGLVLEERPDKVTEAVLLLLQGLGYFPRLSHLAWKKNRQKSTENSPSHSLTPEDQPTPSKIAVEINHEPVLA